MNKVFFAPFALAGALLLGTAAQAQTPHDIQSMIAAGQETQAVQALNNVLTQHPNSGVAWYLLAEAQDAQGHESAAAQALAKAQQIAPGLPFANAQDVAALQAHVAAAPPRPAAHHASPALMVIGGLVLMFLLLRLFGRRRAYAPYGAPGMPGGPTGYGNPGYGPGGGFAGFGGGGLGGSLLGGLAAGAGFAAGERIIDGMMGGGSAQAATPDFPDPGRDDGLLGNPGWDDSGGGGIDTNSWS
ncbi:tetratricopeptide repeat protein [Acidocella sp. KAb 2-4]|uniref:tetratricopeptide repeat protein n=1 Tax=Acidocella sp. KAb 2-4 TaxID=2885158 RepID=UPI001D088DAF|nr:tetratricopeptide repeat protein [Acidocella sp. KAb 2-4]MCB5945274.1 tetratricopeptide repeat protein [Acidocella sp. KAb 2-4]